MKKDFIEGPSLQDIENFQGLLDWLSAETGLKADQLHYIFGVKPRQLSNYKSGTTSLKRAKLEDVVANLDPKMHYKLKLDFKLDPALCEQAGRKLAHAIEAGHLDHLFGKTRSPDSETLVTDAGGMDTVLVSNPSRTSATVCLNAFDEALVQDERAFAKRYGSHKTSEQERRSLLNLKTLYNLPEWELKESVVHNFFSVSQNGDVTLRVWSAWFRHAGTVLITLLSLFVVLKFISTAYNHDGNPAFVLPALALSLVYMGVIHFIYRYGVRPFHVNALMDRVLPSSVVREEISFSAVYEDIAKCFSNRRRSSG